MRTGSLKRLAAGIGAALAIALPLSMSAVGPGFADDKSPSGTAGETTETSGSASPEPSTSENPEPTETKSSEQEVKDATFKWSVNDESTGGSYFGGCNFLVAGKAGDAGSSKVWSAADADKLISGGSTGALKDGNVSIHKSDGKAGTFGNKCKTAGGTSVNGKVNAQAENNHTGDYVQLKGGTGKIDPETDSGEISWDGSFTFVYYGGMTYWTITDPKMIIKDGVGKMTGTYSGVGADMDDPSVWVPDLTKTKDYDKDLFVDGTIMDIGKTGDNKGKKIDLKDDGAKFTPDFLGVKTDRDGRNAQADKTDKNKSWWGSMPDAWVAFNQLTNQDSYWYTTDGGEKTVQPRKSTNDVTLSYRTDDFATNDPGKPTNLDALGVGSDYAILSWEAPEEETRAYDVEYAKGGKKPSSSSGWGKPSRVSSPYKQLRNLDAKTKYSVRVRGVNPQPAGTDDKVGAWAGTTFTTTKASSNNDSGDDGDGNGKGNGKDSDDGKKSSGSGYTFQWAMNREAGSGAFYGGCNFLRAGKAGNAGAAKVWKPSMYKAKSGNVSVRKPSSKGSWEQATWSNKCQDRKGNKLSTGNKDQWSEQQVVIKNGSGKRTGDGGLKVEWDGTFTVAFYGGMTYWFASDPVLTMDKNGKGKVTATASGYGAAMYDSSKWITLKPTKITLADVSGVDLDKADSKKGFTVTPKYLGVKYSGSGGEGNAGGTTVGGEEGNATEQAKKTSENKAHWGSFPQSFVDFQNKTGQFSYWFSSDGVRDPYKPAQPLTVAYSDSYDSDPGGSETGKNTGTEASNSGGPGGPGAADNNSGANDNSASNSGGPAGADDADLANDGTAFKQVAAEEQSADTVGPFTAGQWAAGAGVAGGVAALTLGAGWWLRRRIGLDPSQWL